jgi:hypothetical protein
MTMSDNESIMVMFRRESRSNKGELWNIEISCLWERSQNINK